MERIDYAGMFENDIEHDYPWPFKLGPAQLDALLVEYALFGYPLLVTDSFIPPHHYIMSALADPHSYFNVLLDEGFIKIYSRSGNLVSDIENAADNNISTIAAVVGASNWPEIRRCLEFTGQRAKYVRWPNPSTELLTSRLIENILISNLSRWDLPVLGINCPRAVMDDLLGKLSLINQRQGNHSISNYKRAVYEVSTSLKDKISIPVTDLVHIGIEAYHIGHSIAINVVHGSRLTCHVQTALSANFANFIEKETSNFEILSDKAARIKLIHEVHQRNLTPSYRVSSWALRDFVREGTPLNYLKNKYLDSIERYIEHGHLSEFLEVFNAYRAKLVEHLAKPHFSDITGGTGYNVLAWALKKVDGWLCLGIGGDLYDAANILDNRFFQGTVRTFCRKTILEAAEGGQLADVIQRYRKSLLPPRSELSTFAVNTRAAEHYIRGEPMSAQKPH
jgi:hypothetical protein